MNKETETPLAVALDELGIAKSTLAKAVGVTPATVSRWLSGKRNPSGPRLKRIAEVLRKPVSYFTDAAATPKPARNWRRRYADLILRGVDPDEAWKVVTGNRSPPSGAEWTIVQETTEASRQVLKAASKGDWEKLTPEEQDEILDRIGRLAARRHGR